MELFWKAAGGRAPDRCRVSPRLEFARGVELLQNNYYVLCFCTRKAVYNRFMGFITRYVARFDLEFARGVDRVQRERGVRSNRATCLVIQPIHLL